MKLVHWSGATVTEQANKVRDVTYTNISEVIKFLKEHMDDFRSMRRRISRFCAVADVAAEDSGLSYEYPTMRMILPFKILEYNEGLCFQGDESKHPTLEHVTTIVVGRYSTKLWFTCCRDHETFTVVEEEQ